MFHFKDNKVGINTTPFSTLDINGNTTINGTLNINGNIIPNLNEIYDLGSSDFRWKDIYLSGNTIDLGGTRIQKDINGGIKITNDEGDTLDGKFNNLIIDGNIDISGDLIVKGSTTTINTTSLVIDDPIITLGTLNTNEMLQNDGYNKGVEFTYFTNEAKKGFFGFDNATNDFIYVKDTSNNLGNIRANIFIGDLSGNANYAINANNASTVTNGVYTIGNQNIGGIKNFTNKLGIGSSVPSKELDISGNINFTGNLFQNSSPYIGSQWTKTSNNIYYDTGNVGIGSSIPSASLDVSGNILIRDGTITKPAIAFTTDTNTGLYRPGGDIIGFVTRGNERMRIDAIGNMGIGSSLPFKELDVSGNINFTGNLFQNSSPYVGSQWTTSDNNIYYDTGNVGIGTITPQTKLHINGIVKATTFDGFININNVQANGNGYYTRKMITQIYTTSFNVTTTWVLGVTFDNITDFKPNSLIRISYHIPCRNDTTSWGGCYIEPQVTFNNSTWQSLGSSGYDGGVMNLGNSAIGSYFNSILITPGQTSTYQFRVRFYFRSYDNTTTINGSHDINGVSNSATVPIMSDNNGNQHYLHVIIEELAPFA